MFLCVYSSYRHFLWMSSVGARMADSLYCIKGVADEGHACAWLHAQRNGHSCPSPSLRLAPTKHRPVNSQPLEYIVGRGRCISLTQLPDVTNAA